VNAGGRLLGDNEMPTFLTSVLSRDWLRGAPALTTFFTGAQ